jgi:hypothetical protein
MDANKRFFSKFSIDHLEDPIHIHLALTLWRLILEVVQNKGDGSFRTDRKKPTRAEVMQDGLFIGLGDQGPKLVKDGSLRAHCPDVRANDIAGAHVKSP